SSSSVFGNDIISFRQTPESVTPLQNPLCASPHTVPLPAIFRTGHALGGMETNLAAGKINVEHPLVALGRRVRLPAKTDSQAGGVFHQRVAEIVQRPVLA